MDLVNPAMISKFHLEVCVFSFRLVSPLLLKISLWNKIGAKREEKKKETSVTVKSGTRPSELKHRLHIPTPSAFHGGQQLPAGVLVFLAVLLSECAPRLLPLLPLLLQL